MPKSHWFKFPFQRWLSDPAVRGLSQSSRCVLHDLVCRLASADEFGILRLSPANVARIVPCHVNQFRALIAPDGEGKFPLGTWLLVAPPAGGSVDLTYIDSQQRSHIVLASQPSPLVYSPFLLIDAWCFARDQENGRKGGNKTLVNREESRGLTHGVNPSVSVLSGSEILGNGGAGERGSGNGRHRTATDLLRLGAEAKKLLRRHDQ